MTIKYALIGGGYVLQHLAALLNKSEFLITSRDPQTVNLWRQKGWYAEQFDYANLQELNKLLTKYPGLEVWLDSIPPFSNFQASIENFCELSQRTKLQRILYLSTTGVYGCTDGSWVSETTNLNPQHSKAEQRVLAEKLYSQATMEFSALRISGIYGPKRGTGIALRSGRYPYVDQGKLWSNRIAVSDLAAIIKQLLKTDSLNKLPVAINLSDDEPALVSEVVKFYCEKFRLPIPQSISREQAIAQGMYTVTGNQRVSNKLLHEIINYKFIYPNYRCGAGLEFCDEQV